ncbi:hypothetical protein [Nocardia sp. NPDC057227]
MNLDERDEVAARLAGQTRLTATATALDIVREAWARAVDGESLFVQSDP